MRPSCSPAVPELPRRVAYVQRPVPASAIASAFMVHVAAIGALIASSSGLPVQPAPEAPVEIAVVQEPAVTAPQPAAPTPVASAPAPIPSAAEPAIPPLPDIPPAALADIEPPAPATAPEPVVPVPPPVDVAPSPDPAPSIQPPAPAPQPLRPQPAHPAVQRPLRPVVTARSTPTQQGSAAAIAPARPPAPTSGGETTAAANQEEALEARIRDAVQSAVHYPAAARMMGVTGRARVRFDYRSGSVADPSLAQSSGTPMLDEAALDAARAAHYPPAPAPIEGRLLRLLVWVEFRPG